MAEPHELVREAQDLGQQATELSLFGRERITEAMMTLGEALNKVDMLTLPIDGVQAQLQIVFEQAKALSQEGFLRDDLLQEFERMTKVATIGQAEMLRQRDAVLDEMSEIINRLEAGDFFSDQFKLGGKVYEIAVEQHNAAFWESLPYDMATAMGGKWTHMHADLLHDLIIGGAEEIADGNNLALEDVLAFREVLFEMVNKLYEKGSD
jgi:hypothetical protein